DLTRIQEGNCRPRKRTRRFSFDNYDAKVGVCNSFTRTTMVERGRGVVNTSYGGEFESEWTRKFFHVVHHWEPGIELLRSGAVEGSRGIICAGCGNEEKVSGSGSR